MSDGQWPPGWTAQVESLTQARRKIPQGLEHGLAFPDGPSVSVTVTGRKGRPRAWFGRELGHMLPAHRPTFEGRHLSGLGLGQAFLTSVRGQGQGDATAAQQKPDLLAASVLQKQRRQRCSAHTEQNSFSQPVEN